MQDPKPDQREQRVQDAELDDHEPEPPPLWRPAVATPSRVEYDVRELHASRTRASPSRANSGGRGQDEVFAVEVDVDRVLDVDLAGVDGFFRASLASVLR